MKKLAALCLAVAAVGAGWASASDSAGNLTKVKFVFNFAPGGYDANLIIVDGNPIADIAATERISSVVFKGERIRRAALFTSSQNVTE